MKNIVRYIGCIVLVGVAALFLANSVAHAAEGATYQPLVPLGGEIRNEAGEVTFESYIQGIFNLAIGVAAILAVIMIIVGGIQYMTTVSSSGKDAAKERLTQAVGGLLLALASWLILYTINPNLVTFRIGGSGQLGGEQQVDYHYCYSYEKRYLVDTGGGEQCFEPTLPPERMEQINRIAEESDWSETVKQNVIEEELEKMIEDNPEETLGACEEERAALNEDPSLVPTSECTIVGTEACFVYDEYGAPEERTVCFPERSMCETAYNNDADGGVANATIVTATAECTQEEPGPDTGDVYRSNLESDKYWYRSRDAAPSGSWYIRLERSTSKGQEVFYYGPFTGSAPAQACEEERVARPESIGFESSECVQLNE